MTEDIKISDYAMLRTCGSDILVVALSGVNGPPGKFSYYNNFGTNSDALLLNCPNNEWFVRGVPWKNNETYSLEETVDELARVFEKYKEVILMGGSMGGYGAILLQSFFPNLLTIAMGPEIYPGLTSGMFSHFSKGSSLAYCLSSLFSAKRVSPWIFVGEKKNSDLFGVSEIRSDRIIGLKNAYHAVPAYLHRIFNGIENFVFSVRNGNTEDIIGHARGTLIDHKDVIAVLYYTEIGQISPALAVRHLELIDDASYFKGYLCCEISRIYARHGDHVLALRYAELSCVYNPGDLDGQVLKLDSHLKVHSEAPISNWQKFRTPELESMPLYAEHIEKLSRYSPC